MTETDRGRFNDAVRGTQGQFGTPETQGYSSEMG